MVVVKLWLSCLLQLSRQKLELFPNMWSRLEHQDARPWLRQIRQSFFNLSSGWRSMAVSAEHTPSAPKNSGSYSEAAHHTTKIHQSAVMAAGLEGGH